MPTRYHKLIPLSLPGAEYEALSRIAQEQERDVVQQARWLIREGVRLGNAEGAKLGTVGAETHRGRDSRDEEQ